MEHATSPNILRRPISFFPPFKNGPMPVPALHMTADTTTDEDEPQERNRHAGKIV